MVLAREWMMDCSSEGDPIIVVGQMKCNCGSSRLDGLVYRVQTIILVDRQ